MDRSGIAALEARVAKLMSENEELRTALEETRTALEGAREQNAKLQQRLGLDSTNSNKPPSSDPPWKARPPKHKPKGKSGGKRKRKGRRGHHRERVAPTEIHDLYPEVCGGCGAVLSPASVVGEPWVHQVTELGGDGHRVDEYRRYKARCERCGRRRRAELPAGVSNSAFGPRLTATVVALISAYRLSRRQAQSALQEFWGVQMSLGSVQRCERRMSEAASALVEEVREELKAVAELYVDETGWRRGRERPWLWVLCTMYLSSFWIEPKRNKKTAGRLLDGFEGVVCSDDCGVYHVIEWERRQLCWSHRIRDFERLSQYRYEPAYSRVGRVMLRISQRLFHELHRVRDGTLEPEVFARRAGRLRAHFECVCRWAIELQPGGLRRKFSKLLKQAGAYWRFVTQRGLELTNNCAERALRHAVIWRRISYGHRSEAGRLFVERMLTVVQTLRQQKRSVMSWLLALATPGAPVPSLLPSG